MSGIQYLTYQKKKKNSEQVEALDFNPIGPTVNLRFN